MATKDQEAATGGVKRRNTDVLLLGGLSLAVLLTLSLAPALFNDGDMSWHLAAGQWMIDRGAVPDSDPFSFTYAGRPWLAHEWLSEVFMAAVWRLGSWPALSLLFGSAVAILLLIIGLEARRWHSGLTLTAFIIAVFVILSPFLLARPHVLAWPILAGWTVILLRAREADNSPPLRAAALMLLWANMHGSFVFGLLLIGPFALEALLASEDRKPVLLGWGMFGLLSLLASIVTPHGIHGLLFPLQVSRMEALPLIMEWRPTIVSDMPGFAAVFLGTVFALLYLGVRVPALRLAIIIGLIYLALEHVRHQAVLGILGALLLLEPVARARSGGCEGLPRNAKRPQHFVPILILLAAAMGAIRFALPAERQDSPSNPLSAISRLPAELRQRPVLNSYGFGGPLILERIRPFIDGRADLYGDDFVMAHQRMIDGDLPAFRRAAERWNIGWTILSPQDALAGRLDREPGWRRLYQDQWAIVHVRAGN